MENIIWKSRIDQVEFFGNFGLRRRDRMENKKRRKMIREKRMRRKIYFHSIHEKYSLPNSSTASGKIGEQVECSLLDSIWC
mmetsp:Transcript_38458/g.79926  ORF Transcript_38458/g.79926 Transcript_38458/m.79926 type:complete len:81 (+) Transcript_38458:117-359(+)